MPYLKLDDALVDMIEGHRETIVKFLADHSHCGSATLWDADIAWDFPMSKTDEWDEEDATVSHSIGFITGCAAAFDVTPLELLDVIKVVLGKRERGPALPAPTSQRKRKMRGS